MAMAVAENKPHAVCIPYPAQSHIKGMMKLAKLLHHRGFFITFVNTEFNQNRLTKAGGPDSLNGFPNFQFKTIPDSLPPSDPNATHGVAAPCGSVRRNFLTPFRNLLAKLNDDDNATAAVTCIVSDGVMPFTIKVADELRIPVAMFWTFAACGFMGFFISIVLYWTKVLHHSKLPSNFHHRHHVSRYRRSPSRLSPPSLTIAASLPATFSLPKYESSHEFQTKKKRQQQRQNEEMAKRQKLQHPQQHARLIACFCRHDKEGNAGFVVFAFVDYALHHCPAVWLRNTSFLMRATS